MAAQVPSNPNGKSPKSPYRAVVNTRYFAYHSAVLAAVQSCPLQFDDKSGKLVVGPKMKLRVTPVTLDIELRHDLAVQCYQTALSSKSSTCRTITHKLPENTDDPFFLGCNHITTIPDWVVHKSKLPASILQRAGEILKTEGGEAKLMQFLSELFRELAPTENQDLIVAKRRSSSPPYQIARLIESTRRLSEKWHFEAKDLVRAYQDIGTKISITPVTTNENTEMETQEPTPVHADVAALLLNETSENSANNHAETITVKDDEANQLEQYRTSTDLQDGFLYPADIDSLGTDKDLSDKAIDFAMRTNPVFAQLGIFVVDCCALEAYVLFPDSVFPVPHLEFEQIHFVAHQGGRGHWILLVYLPKRAQLFVLDSLPPVGPFQLRETYPEVVKIKSKLERLRHGKQVRLEFKRVPQQDNAHDCGIFAILFAEVFAESYQPDWGTECIFAQLATMDMKSNARLKRLRLWLDAAPLPPLQIEHSAQSSQPSSSLTPFFQRTKRSSNRDETEEIGTKQRRTSSADSVVNLSSSGFFGNDTSVLPAL